LQPFRFIAKDETELPKLLAAIASSQDTKRESIFCRLPVG